MSELKREFKTKLKAFQYLGIMVIIASIALMISFFDPNDAEMKSKVFSFGGLAGFFGAFLLYFGFKERKIQIYDNKIEYHTSKLVFESSFENLALVKTYQEQGKKSENLILMKEDDTVVTISDAFFPHYLLKDAFHELVKLSENYSFTIEDDLNWKS